MPPNSLKFSVYQTLGKGEDEIWEIGQKYVIALSANKKPIVGRGDLESDNYLRKGLKINITGVPHPDHCEVVNWPQVYSEQKLIAGELALEAKYRKSQA